MTPSSPVIKSQGPALPLGLPALFEELSYQRVDGNVFVTALSGKPGSPEFPVKANSV